MISNHKLTLPPKWSRLELLDRKLCDRSTKKREEKLRAKEIDASHFRNKEVPRAPLQVRAMELGLKADKVAAEANTVPEGRNLLAVRA